MVNLENRLGVLDTKKDIFKDIDLSFKRNPITNDVRVKTDAAAVNQSLKNIILTNFFERPLDPSFGGNIWEMLFEPLDEFSAINIRERMIKVIEKNEPRVENIQINIKQARDEYPNTMVISLLYNIPSSNTIISTQFSVERVR
tara:strand:+ start:185 stop:613 length:429 start_codon:yes stop_codon:yes gene_type:complete